MILFPLPFLTAFFLVVVLLHLTHYVEHGLPRLVLLTTAAYAIHAVLMGLHWGFDIIPAAIVASFALALPALTWLTLYELSGQQARHLRLKVGFGIGAAIALLNAAFLVGFTPIVDSLGILLYTGFGGHLLWTGLRGDIQWLSKRPLYAVVSMQRAYVITGGLLLISAAVDASVAVDVKLNNSQISSALVAYSNLTLLFILMVVFFRTRSRPAAQTGKPSIPAPPYDPRRTPQAAAPAAHDPAEPDAQQILERLNAEMDQNHLYRSENLSLSQIASRIRAPARQVSSAVNSLCAMNVPQYVNTFRIRDACRMLEETDIPITGIVFEVGFTTKSNFNREFQRVTGLSPSAWREKARQHESDTEAEGEKSDYPSTKGKVA
ncbi:AraC family transcriptional regulator [Phaeobacter sp. HF9A]|uniref:helix-turn-helix domain-containing protein n=1 Tax=Phaeobacter sp. HF9A TaxID=2721561 RepID=UPI00142F408A|nr:AraC family transcriptional regulator [Phaeobacter sp. HF9A]NIZ13564.1 helix-turn-helix transcriptional regulator [Phaeobacter sp. HF9A]